jgi:hypothetical protein
MAQNFLTTPYATQGLILNPGVVPLLQEGVCRLYTAISGTPSTPKSFTEANFFGYTAQKVPAAPFAGGPVAGNGVELDYPLVLWTTNPGTIQQAELTISGTTKGTWGVAITVSRGGLRDLVINIQEPQLAAKLTSPGTIADAVAAALNANVVVKSFMNSVGPLNPTATGPALMTFLKTAAAANDPDFKVSLASYYKGYKIANLPVNSTITVQGVAPVAINQTILGVYVTDSTGTVLLGWQQFAAPVVLTKGGQNIVVQCGIPWAA